MPPSRAIRCSVRTEQPRRLAASAIGTNSGRFNARTAATPPWRHRLAAGCGRIGQPCEQRSRNQRFPSRFDAKASPNVASCRMKQVRYPCHAMTAPVSATPSSQHRRRVRATSTARRRPRHPTWPGWPQRVPAAPQSQSFRRSAVAVARPRVREAVHRPCRPVPHAPTSPPRAGGRHQARGPAAAQASKPTTPRPVAQALPDPITTPPWSGDWNRFGCAG